MEQAARAAYEAFCQAIGAAMSLDQQLQFESIAVKWEDLPQRLQDGWVAAAKAAIEKRSAAIAKNLTVANPDPSGETF